jgi:hypothetical protein
MGNDNDCTPMQELLVAQIWLLFSYFDPYQRKDISFALVMWFIHPGNNPEHDKDTEMWGVVPKHGADDEHLFQIIHLNMILRGIHLLPCYGEWFLLADLECDKALDA